MAAWGFGALLAIYCARLLHAYVTRDLTRTRYPSPEEAQAQVEIIARAHPQLCLIEEIGRSTKDRIIHALRFSPAQRRNDAARPAVLITAQIHAVEFIGSYVARALAARLVAGYGRVAAITSLLERADVWVVPLLNPDGASRVWRSGGWGFLGSSRATANGVDPNRNFPFIDSAGKRAWNSARDRPGSAYYRGPRPLSEPECLALAKLCKRVRFCAAINFHSFGGVVFMPDLRREDVRAREILASFDGFFQARQPHLHYRTIREHPTTILGQLDPFLLEAFGTPSATIEVSRPGLRLLLPSQLFNIFAWFNPPDPEHWVENDVEAAIAVLCDVLRRSDGVPCSPTLPELAEQIPD